MDMTESQTNLGFLGIKKAKIPKFDEKLKNVGGEPSVGNSTVRTWSALKNPITRTFH